MPTVRVVAETPLPPDVVLEAGRDFSVRRAELWPDVHAAHLHVDELGDTYADVTEGNPWPIGFVWERLRYDWSRPDALRAVVTDSNIFRAGSTWELWATRSDSRTRVEVRAVRRLKGKGLLLAPFFPLGLANQSVAAHLRHFLARVEQDAAR